MGIKFICKIRDYQKIYRVKRLYTNVYIVFAFNIHY